jgi:hypothetical protein
VAGLDWNGSSGSNGGKAVPARSRRLGSTKDYEPIEPAPGRYVKEKRLIVV